MRETDLLVAITHAFLIAYVVIGIAMALTAGDVEDPSRGPGGRAAGEGACLAAPVTWRGPASPRRFVGLGLSVWGGGIA